MGIKIGVAGRVRGLFAGQAYSENREDEQLHVNPRGDLIIAQAMPEQAELVRLGNSYQAAYETGLASLTALPTTTAGLSIYNGEPANGALYVIDSFGSWEGVVDATQTDYTAIFANQQIAGGSFTKPTASTITTQSLSGRAAYGGNAIIAAAATVVNTGWFPHACPTGSVTAVAGGIWKVNEVPVRGLYCVKPGGMFSISSVKGTAAALQQFYFIRWHEVMTAYKA